MRMRRKARATAGSTLPPTQPVGSVGRSLANLDIVHEQLGAGGSPGVGIHIECG